jgi:hypothetical protein
VHPVEALQHERDGGGAAPAEDDGADGHALGLLYSRLWHGLLLAGAVKRELGCAAFSVEPFFQGRPCQSVSSSGTSPSISSHHTSPSSVRATLVKMVSRWMVFIAFGLDFMLVPGATPK